jgi:hypothetical protein
VENKGNPQINPPSKRAGRTDTVRPALFVYSPKPYSTIARDVSPVFALSSRTSAIRLKLPPECVAPVSVDNDFLSNPSRFHTFPRLRFLYPAFDIIPYDTINNSFKSRL